MKIDTKKIGAFLKSINDAEYIYITHCMNMRNGISSLIKKHNLSKEEVCQAFGIKPSKYDDYVKGNYNYSLMDMACLNCYLCSIRN
jgi:predicted XRE-type DNA-binding protein